VIGENAHGESALLLERNQSRAGGKLVGADLVARRRRIEEHRPGADDDTVHGLNRREEETLQDVAHADRICAGHDMDESVKGTIVRVMRFQSLVSLIGITGWMFRVYCEPERCAPSP
jgi:hypothetical protein